MGERSIISPYNRLLKKLSQKDRKEIELEKREHGFSLYLNGANTASHSSRTIHRHTTSHTHSKPAHTSTEDNEGGPCANDRRPSHTASGTVYNTSDVSQ